MTLSRRELFVMLRRPATGAPAAEPARSPVAPPAALFSLDTFYARRRGEPSARAHLDPAWVPEVVSERCLARSFCTVCIDRCPTPGAIALAGGRPRVDPARCDGCGVCVAVCPAPTLAFQLVRRGRGGAP